MLGFSAISVAAALTGTLIDQTKLPLSTQGANVVDTDGNPVRLACVNLYGAHMERYVINGLDLVDINELA